MVLISFRDWLESSQSTVSMEPGYDQNLQEPEGLAYKKPTIPNFRTRMGAKIDKIFGKKGKDHGLPSPGEKRK